MTLIIQTMRSGRIVIKTAKAVDITSAIIRRTKSTDIASGGSYDTGYTTEPSSIEVYDSTNTVVSPLTLGPPKITRPGGAGTNWYISFPNYSGGGISGAKIKFLA